MKLKASPNLYREVNSHNNVRKLTARMAKKIIVNVWQKKKLVVSEIIVFQKLRSFIALFSDAKLLLYKYHRSGNTGTAPLPPHLVCDGDLCESERLVEALVRLTHLRLDVVKEQRECLAAEAGDLTELALETAQLLGARVGHVEAGRQRVDECHAARLGRFYEGREQVCAGATMSKAERMKA